MVFNNLLTLEVLTLLTSLTSASKVEVPYPNQQQIHLHPANGHSHHHHSSNSSPASNQERGSTNSRERSFLPGHRKFDLFENSCPIPSSELVPWPGGLGKESNWTEVPLCTRMPHFTATTGVKNETGINDAFCIFSTKSFQGGRGLSVATKPHIASKIANLPAFKMSAGVDLWKKSYPPFEIKPVPGKGMGVIANRTIFRGERLFAHAAVGIYHNDIFLTRRSKDYRLRNRMMEVGVEQLPEESRRKFHAMIGQKNAHHVVQGQLNVNTFGEDFGGEEHSIIIPETARMNHDCRPNSMYYFDPETLIHYTQAARTINAGEEVTITYIDPLQSREDRQKAITYSWGFQCTCSHCLQPSAYSEASDGRILAINSLVKLLLGETKLKGNTTPSAGEKTKIAELLVDLYEQERLVSHIVDAWMWAAQTHKEAGNSWESLRWTYRSEEGSLIHEGPRNEAATRMGNLVQKISEEVGVDLGYLVEGDEE
ncbi:hypothetical protein HYFRA_00013828 [Hymenoscyphus fraxineus]|uniref:SET domain-containing protein n=1 Tax=Hymenoscyphus fraxineus TaxID=746836 RepID=A0A9N9LBZ0_9HELO|nr:hypothetical protein HYFRA_00013828 [Hymenoscyphus fraxineus]